MNLGVEKREIIRRFNKNVRGKKPDLLKYEIKHDGKEGHWLEVKMEIVHNSRNLPDLFGYEMKKSTNGKTSFGDWSADYYIYKDAAYGITRDRFLQLFGKSNLSKKGRFSWSGEACPTIRSFNYFGQRLLVDGHKNILAVYSFSEDKRQDKKEIMPKIMQKDNLIIARWDVDSIRKKLERKFNVKGWFRCIKDKKGIYAQIVFGDPVTFEKWIEDVKGGEVFFDSGMYQGNIRPYSQWRANNSYWDKLITSTY